MCESRFLKAALLLLCTLVAACDKAAQRENAESPTRLVPKPCWFETDDSWPVTQCFMMEVPENYAKPTGRKIQFPVVRFLAAEPDSNKQPLLHLGAGGPGASLGLEPENASEWLWINYAAMTVDDGRDLIVMDPRGTGMAQPRLACSEFIEDAHTAFQRNLSADEEARVFTFSMERCYSRLSKDADLASYNSATVARDVEALRELLGVEKFNLYGVSYASRYALTLARDYPQSVRALILNSAVFPEIIYTQKLAKDSLAAYQRGLKHCIEDKLCNSRYPDLRRRLENLVQTLDENPRTIPVKHRFSDQEYPFVLSGQRLLRVVFQALYDESFLDDFPKMIESLENDESPDQQATQKAIASFMEILLDPYFGDAAGVSHFCYEEAPFVDFDKARASAADSGILGGAVRADIELMQVQCRIWAIPSAPLLESRAIATPLPVMVLHGGLDPVLAVDEADRARRKLPNHQWLLFPKLAHDVISASNCAEQAAARFLDNPEEDQSEPAKACRQEEIAREIPAGGEMPEDSQYSQQH
ncbi:alpha/beta fold hydrolase [Microbulbifer taiwanensis]|uniref:Alpha/beta fold hydrolase n=1 Tax=Microbulbifer taiwanensis TaxID=986746 RepID=A0ABW1YGI8_9GAMM|nr:alpha/beta fold hydrolase [Microbulbifer taiwanensis]